MPPGNPGPTPRSLNFEQALGQFPVVMQVGLFVAPVVILGGVGYALLFRGGLAGLLVAGIAVFVFVLNMLSVWSHVHRVRNFPAAPGRIWNYTLSDDSVSTVMLYSFELDGEGYEGEYILRSGPQLPIGSPIWILYNPKYPGDSVPWLDD